MSPIMMIMIINTLFWGILGYIFYDRIYMIKLFNLNEKCYMKVSEDHLKSVQKELIEENITDDYIKFEDKYVTLLYQKYKIHDDGNIIILNHKGRLIEQGIIIPIFCIICCSPVIIYLIPMRNIMLLVILFTYVVWFYKNIMTYLKMKFSKIDDLDENTCYKHNYITYIMYYNRLFLIEALFVLFGYLPSRANILLIVLLIILIRMHLTLFIDKIDKWLPWNVLEKHNMDTKNSIEYAIAMSLLGFSNIFLALNPLHFTF
jgi:hypothetical protein